MKVITFSRVFPIHHPRKGQPTHFIRSIWEGLDIKNMLHELNDPMLEEDIKDYYTKTSYTPKWHTIRAGNRWKVGDWFSPRVWSGKPYASKQIIFALPIQIKKIWDFKMDLNGVYSVGKYYMENELYEDLAMNDGLSQDDMFSWFMPNYNKPKEFKGQILCWNEDIEYVEAEEGVQASVATGDDSSTEAGNPITEPK